jgi:predicted RNase H-like HicB family nuclease
LKEYIVVFEWAGHNYSAYVPDLPGCAATGKTIEETEQRIRKAIELYIEVLKEDGRSVPEPTTTARPVAVAA